ncbi:MAG: Ig-like domain-containing protein [Bryobacteraceae bacterium]
MKLLFHYQNHRCHNSIRFRRGRNVLLLAAVAFLARPGLALTDVRNAGATGNGSTDDTLAIQSAINSAPSGDTVVFPGGTYRITSTISVPSNRILQGQSGAMLKIATGQFALSFPYDSASNITIDGLTMDGGGVNVNGNSVPAYNVQIKNSTFQNIVTSTGDWTTHNAIFIPGGLTQSSITANRFLNILEGGLTDYVDRMANGIMGWRLNAVTISDNTFDTVNQGISLKFDRVGTYGGVAILRNVGTRVHRMGVETQGSYTQGMLVEGNQFSNFLNPFWNSFGMSIVVDGGAGTIIRNNMVDASPAAGSGSRYGYGLEVSGTNTTVSGNTVKNGFSTGIAIGWAQGMVITGNYLCGSTQATVIAFEAASQPDAQIANNTKSATCSSAAPPPAPAPVPPAVSLAAPISNSTVSGTVTITANVTSAVSIASVSFILDGSTTIAQDANSPYSMSWNSAAVADGAHTLKAVAVDTNGASGTSTIISLTTLNSANPTPAVTKSGLKLWLNSAAGVTTQVDKVSKWLDQSGSGIQASQSNSNAQPSLVTTARGRVIRFDGTADALTFPMPINGWNGMTIFLVSATSQKSTGGWSKAENAALFWDESAWWGTTYLSPWQSNVAFRFGTTQANNWPLYSRPVPVSSGLTLTEAVKASTVDKLYLNGVLAYSEGGKYSTVKGTSNTGVLGQGYNNTFFAGDIAEVLVYNRALTDAERQGVESYLMNKYGLK